MKYYFRLIWLLLVVWFRKPSAALGPCKTPMRVWPNDLDIFLHMNNGAYLTIMDLARTDMMVRSGLATRILQNRWYPVVAAETIRFKKPLKLFHDFCPHRGSALPQHRYWRSPTTRVHRPRCLIGSLTGSALSPP